MENVRMFFYALAFALGVIMLDSLLRSDQAQIQFSDSRECSDFVKEFDTWSPELQSNFDDWSVTCEVTGK